MTRNSGRLLLGCYSTSPLNVVTKNTWDSSMLAGATGFEPVAFGFGVCERGVYNPPRIFPALIESHG